MNTSLKIYLSVLLSTLQEVRCGCFFLCQIFPPGKFGNLLIVRHKNVIYFPSEFSFQDWMKLSDFIVVLPRMVGKCSKFRRDLLSYCSIVLFSPSRCCRCRGFLKNARFSFSSPIVYKSIIKIDIILRQHRSLLSLERQNAQFRWINRIIKLSKKNRKCLKAKLRGYKAIELLRLEASHESIPI